MKTADADSDAKSGEEGAAMQPYRLMALNNAWANARLYGALRGLSAAAFTAARPGFFPSLAATLNHIHEVDLYYLDALERGGAGRAVYDRPEIDDPAALGALQADADLRLAQFCRALDPAALAETRKTERADGAVTERVDALLLHLFQHQIHHRGQAHVQVQHAGIAPPQLDEFYLDYDRHPTAAPYHG
ncbi:DinB family protein [Nitratireductor sp. StC3]|uniref:DinB family protein n=1 Tax=Nitratireductor sp. StC3 TaxID=2126741 RepID=UPI001FDEF554|nr:DinB family protein [Nitratireductor sp. StC3]